MATRPREWVLFRTLFPESCAQHTPVAYARSRATQKAYEKQHHKQTYEHTAFGESGNNPLFLNDFKAFMLRVSCPLSLHPSQQKNIWILVVRMFAIHETTSIVMVRTSNCWILPFLLPKSLFALGSACIRDRDESERPWLGFPCSV